MSSNGVLDRWHAGCTVPGTWNAGVDGDQKHAGHGYHIWRLLLVWLDYSSGRGLNASTRDFGGRSNTAAGVDRGGPPAAVVVMTRRLLAALTTPRGRYLLRGVREFNGSADGVTTLNRDAVLGWAQNYLPDASHKTHIHIGWFRDTCEDPAVVGDCLSVVNGTADIFGAAPQGGTTAPITSEEDEVSAAVDKIMDVLGETLAGVGKVWDRLDAVTPGKKSGRPPYFTVTDGQMTFTWDRSTPGAMTTRLLDNGDGNAIMLTLRALIAKVDAGDGALVAQLDELTKHLQTGAPADNSTAS